MRRENESLQELLMYSNMASMAEAMYSPGGVLGHIMHPEMSEEESEMHEEDPEGRLEGDAFPAAIEEAEEVRAEVTGEEEEQDVSGDEAMEMAMLDGAELVQGSRAVTGVEASWTEVSASTSEDGMAEGAAEEGVEELGACVADTAASREESGEQELEKFSEGLDELELFVGQVAGEAVAAAVEPEAEVEEAPAAVEALTVVEEDKETDGAPVVGEAEQVEGLAVDQEEEATAPAAVEEDGEALAVVEAFAGQVVEGVTAAAPAEEQQREVVEDSATEAGAAAALAEAEVRAVDAVAEVAEHVGAEEVAVEEEATTLEQVVDSASAVEQGKRSSKKSKKAKKSKK